MFEAHVLYLLRQYLGEYVRGLSAEALKISVWKGDVILKDLQLKAEALNALRLPITVRAGFLGSVTLKVPWNRLGKDPVIVLLDRIFILAEPLQDDLLFSEDKKTWLDAKRRQIEEAELAMLEAKDKRSSLKETSPETSSWLGSLIATIVGNLKISVTNLHIRYEDTVSNPNHPFCSGITLGKLAAVTIDEKGMETFVTSGALDRLRKSLQLQHFAVYHDSDTHPWMLKKSWGEMTPEEWSEIFESGVHSAADEVSLDGADKHQYLLQPVGGTMKYHRCGKHEKRDPEHPFQKASLVLDQVSLTISEAQYRDGLKLLEGVSSYRTRIEFSRLRPQVSVANGPQLWWLYACQAVLQQQSRMWYRLSWEKVSRYCHLRRRYVQLYASSLQQGSKIDNPEIQDIDEELSLEVILLWRLLAHAKVESSKVKEAALAREVARKSSWWSFGRGPVGTGVSSDNSSLKEVTGQPASGHFTKEEWSKLNELLSYQPGQESPLSSGQEAPNMLQTALDVTIQHSAASIINSKGLEVLCGSFENLQIALDVYPKSLICNVKLQFYGLSAPEGSLIESVSREGREDALLTTFFHNPLEENLDWKLSLTMSACHVTVWRSSFDRFLEFLRTGQALSPSVALETAAVLQSKLEEVTRKAQEQLQLVLKQQKRFSVDLDVDAPKLRIPTFTSNEGGQEMQLVLDLGHFKLHTSPDKDPLEDTINMESLYSRLHISGSDISAFFVDGGFDWSKYSCLASPMFQLHGADPLDGAYQVGSATCAVFPILDRCGMHVILDQTRVQHPDYPSTRVSIEVPRLSFYFSPVRYLGLLRLLAAVEKVHEDSEVDVVKVSAWHQADFFGDARVLNWGGIGNTVAEWQPCWASLAGSYLYILDSEGALSYSRCCSMNNKQVLEIPSENIGGSDFVIALCNRGMDLQKAIESSNTIVMQLRNAETKAAWIKYLTLAIYKASAPVSVSLPTELNVVESINDNQPLPADPSKQLDLFITGSLKELQVFLCGTTMANGSLDNEVPILELQASGGQVDYLQRPFDMSMGIRLHALKVKDRLQGSVSSCQYIACSVLSSSEELEARKHLTPSSSENLDEESELFRDALSDFNAGSSEINPLGLDSSSSSSQTDGVSRRKPSVLRLDPTYLVKAGRMTDFIFEDLEEEALDFVSVLLFIRQSGSPDYDGTDTQMSINMATLDFFCNRPTVVALINFGTDISRIMEAQDALDPPVKSQSAEVTSPDEGSDSSERSIVKGLLGKGKSRIVFRLRMALKSARIYLNQEDGSQLAMLAQDKFHMDLKVYPGSFSISGTLGNLRVCDMLLGPNHHWGWLCDIRDPGCGSLVKLDFHSYNKEDDDYQGYDYSLFGKLSAVRIVFLYRFIQEVIAYFGALATPQVQEVITVVDNVGGIERMIPQADMDGAPAIKLNVSLDTPIIIVPRKSSSKEFMQLDLGRLEVYNIFEWHGGRRNEPSAIHLDVLSVEITGINMFVGIEGKLGKAMIQEASGVHIKVSRPLRDLFKQMPEVQVDVQVESLRGIMSDKEYLVITDCAATNVGEPAKFPPNFRDDHSSEPEDLEFSVVKHQEPEREEATSHKSNSEEQAFSTWTKVWVTVDVKHSELELCTGDRDLSLARVQIQGLWLGYRNTSTDEMDLYITVPKLSIFDERAGTKPEMQLMLGSVTDVENCVSENTAEVQTSIQSDSDVNLTMLVMDLRMKPDSQAFVIRIQRPRLLVVVDFILSVAQFFVPSLSTLTGQDSANIRKDPIVACDYIRLTASDYQQKENVVTLSSDCQLIADAHDVDEFIYDGCGSSLYLNLKDYVPYSISQPLIVVGCGKNLRFKNIHIKNGLRINECISLASNSSYSISPEDGVIISNLREDALRLDADEALGDSVGASPSGQVTTGGQKTENTDLNLVLDIQVVAPEFTFYDSTKWPSKNSSPQERLLRAKFDFNFMLALKGNDRWIKAFLKGLNVEAGSGLAVVDPLDVSGEYVCAHDKTNFYATVTEISIRLSLNVLRLMMRLQADIASKFQIGGVNALSQCTHFDRIWIDHSGNPLQQVAIWRPRAPPGFVILSDCATSGAAPPSQAVMAVSNSYFRVKKPVSFQLIWCSWGKSDGLRETSPKESSIDIDVENVCSIWLPIAPPGYVSVGCVAERGRSPPLLSVVHCIRSDLVTSASVTDCIFYVPPDERKYKQGCSIWRVENAVGSFFAHFSVNLPSQQYLCDLREVLLQTLNVVRNDEDKIYPEIESLPIGRSKRLDSGNSLTRSERSGSIISKCGRNLTTTAQFERLWWDKGSESRQAISLWRPLPPPGYAIIGDILVEGLEPPGVGVVLHDDDSGRLTKPVSFEKHLQISGKGLEDLYIWSPVAPPGFVALGCVATKSQDIPSPHLVRCVRTNLVMQVNLSKRPLWSYIGSRGNDSCSLWRVENQARNLLTTFFWLNISSTTLSNVLIVTLFL
ncbi:hypothetical protein O6H91_19G024000 [Diphasiastrum complanatum]|uniref:Uncharacterized protein n=8 Tax=Diphasiastrum complanatum TaxID=34168 RepID=A0ACC2ATN6_DIPCM|nr:hypothetical protein O6H91_19G024000 [Diphasiastrum complanatum]